MSILEPVDGQSVVERQYVSGKTTDSSAEVWVIIHPMEVSDYWVQPRTSVRDDGTWKVSAYVGRPGGIDVGRLFEIRAVANPKQDLREGQVLSYWPEAQWKSKVIEVKRK
ncbi:MAG: hypothetical protein FJY85_12990 [Deltaproteobacteria bacterium]|nr:hypothetical protein [Deltaproteobacteria bacterium]